MSLGFISAMKKHVVSFIQIIHFLQVIHFHTRDLLGQKMRSNFSIFSDPKGAISLPSATKLI